MACERKVLISQQLAKTLAFIQVDISTASKAFFAHTMVVLWLSPSPYIHPFPLLISWLLDNYDAWMQSSDKSWPGVLRAPIVFCNDVAARKPRTDGTQCWWSKLLYFLLLDNDDGDERKREEDIAMSHWSSAAITAKILIYTIYMYSRMHADISPEIFSLVSVSFFFLAAGRNQINLGSLITRERENVDGWKHME